jgi:hypothetical protein
MKDKIQLNEVERRSILNRIEEFLNEDTPDFIEETSIEFAIRDKLMTISLKKPD